MNGRPMWRSQALTSSVRPPRSQPSRLRSLWLKAGGSAVVLCSSGLWSPALLAAPAEVPPAASPAAPPATTAPAAPSVPPVVSDLLQRWDAAASRKDLSTTLKLYSSTFTHADGLDFKTQQQVLKQFWQTTKSIQYQTQVNRWTAEAGNRYVVETTTQLKGVRTVAEQDMALSSTIRSRITIADKKIQAQEILSEQTRLTAGDRPPEVVLNLPEQVNVGQNFNFEAIVKTPLGDELLMGSALEETITPEQYLNPSPITLVYPAATGEALKTEHLLCSIPAKTRNEPPNSLCSAGGLFKVGQAPSQPVRKWLSAIFVKYGGMTIVSQRLNVVRPNGSTQPTSP